MNNYYNYLIFFFIFTTSIAVTHCEDSGIEMLAAGRSTEKLEVVPAPAISVGFLDEVVFDVTLKSSEGKAVSGAPIIVSFVGDSQNASLDPTQFNTSEQGKGQVRFIAPNQDVSFTIRFKSPGDETEVEVIVDPSMFSVIVEVDYEGERELSSLDAVLHENTICDDISATEVETLRTIRKPALFPASFFIDGLAAETNYAITVTGKNAHGQTRSAGCVDGISTSSGIEPLVLKDTPLDIAGIYTAETRLEIDGVMDVIVDRLKESIEIIETPESAVLNDIGTVLADDPFAKETYDQHREEHSLDSSLAGYFEDKGIDVARTLEPTWQDMKEALSSLVLAGRMELETSQDGNLNIYHTLERMRFYQNGGDPLEYALRQPSTGTGTALLQPNDTLDIEPHQINLGLGEPLSFLFRSALNDNLGTPEINQALLTVIDCDGVADFLEPLLADVTTRLIIRQGCQLASETAKEQLDAEIATLNQYDQITFEGNCLAEVPLYDDEIDVLVSDDFTVIWGDLHTMDAAFQAIRANAAPQ